MSERRFWQPTYADADRTAQKAADDRREPFNIFRVKSRYLVMAATLGYPSRGAKLVSTLYPDPDTSREVYQTPA